jgi:hypothetical protein
MTLAGLAGAACIAIFVVLVDPALSLAIGDRRVARCLVGAAPGASGSARARGVLRALGGALSTANVLGNCLSA